MLGIVQAGSAPFRALPAELRPHVAWVIEHCEGAGINTIEATPEAEEGWLMELYMAVGGMPDYSGNCTPATTTRKATGAKAARNLTYIGSLLDYDGFLQRWRADAAETASTRRTHDLIGRAQTPSRPGPARSRDRARHHPSRAVARIQSVGRAVEADRRHGIGSGYQHRNAVDLEVERWSAQA